MTSPALKIVLFTFAILALPLQLYGQTCSCAGAPLISSHSISSAAQNNLLAGLTYQHNDISQLYSGSSRIDDPTLARTTRTTLLELNYGITDRLTVTGITTYIEKTRRSGINSPGQDNVLTTRGLGDGLFILKYVLHKNTIREQYQLALGGGAKIPIGRSDLTRNGLPLNADMQPGTGAWDGVVWSYFSKTFAPESSMNLFLYASYRATGENKRFSENDIYEFGNELVINSGVTDKISDRLSYIGMLRYRSTSSDTRNGQIMPNTGGKWLSIRPALRYRLTKGLSTKISGKIPIYQHLNGLQPTTAYSLSISLFYNFGQKLIY